MDVQEEVLDTSVDATQREGFKIDYDDCTFGQVLAKGRYRPRSNFIIELETYVEAGNNTGFFAWVTRRSDRLRKLCYYSMDSLFVKQKFINELRTTYGFGGLNCSLNERDLADFHNFLEKNFPFNDPGKTKYGASCVGLQPKNDTVRLHTSDVWILNPEVHINAEGHQIDLQESNYVWLPTGGPYIESSYNKNSYQIDIRSAVKTPLESHQSLSLLLSNMKSVLKHNFIPGLYTLGSAVMGVHFEILVERQGGCPLPMIIGEPETGKSTAVKCALSLCGQHRVGNIMKTKATSDSICTERMTHSTLPFLLDDPKSPEEIGELLITLYDGAFSGNMRKGLRKPRTMPIFSCNFSTISKIQRYASRSLVIPFQLPAVGPTDEKETKEFQKLPDTMTNASSAVGWVISMGQQLKQGKQFEGDMLKTVSAKLKGVNSRLCTSYTTLLYCVKKIAEEAGQNYLAHEAEDFLSDILPFIVTSECENLKSTISCDNVITPVLNCVSSLVDWAMQKKQEGKLCEVLQSVRTGVSFQGKHSLAIVLDDICHLKFCEKPRAIRQCIKDNNLGKINIAKDFLPAKSSSIVIKRGENSHSRKCVVVKLDTLPQKLQKQVIEATTTQPASIEKDQNTMGFQLSQELGEDEMDLWSNQDLIAVALEQSESIENEQLWNSSEDNDAMIAVENSLLPELPTSVSDQQPAVALELSASLPLPLMQPASKINNCHMQDKSLAIEISQEQKFKVGHEFSTQASGGSMEDTLAKVLPQQHPKTGQKFSGQAASLSSRDILAEVFSPDSSNVSPSQPTKIGQTQSNTVNASNALASPSQTPMTGQTQSNMVNVSNALADASLSQPTKIDQTQSSKVKLSNALADISPSQTPKIGQTQSNTVNISNTLADVSPSQTPKIGQTQSNTVNISNALADVSPSQTLKTGQTQSNKTQLNKKPKRPHPGKKSDQGSSTCKKAKTVQSNRCLRSNSKL